jgi:peptidoglycan/LPS O-acetylase OafA/YrhL
MTSSSKDLLDTPPTERSPAFDVLRGCLTLLVVFHHTAITYGAIGGWFYREIEPHPSLSGTLLVFFCTVNQAYFMGLFFLLAGYFTPLSLQRKGTWRFLLDRLLRLGLPLMFFGWILGPATIALARARADRPFFEVLMGLWKHGTFEAGPLWFAEALLLFALGAIAWSWVPRRAGSDVRADDHAALPSDRTLLIATLATGGASGALRAVWPVGVNVWNLQLAYFSSYVLLFVVGCIAARPRWLERVPPQRVRRWWRVSLVALPVLPAVYFLGKVVPALQGTPLDLVYAFWEPFVAWGVILKLLQVFQARFNTAGVAWRELGRRAYAIFIIHPPVVVGITLAWTGVSCPALLKFAVTGSLSCLVCYVIAGLLLRWPVLRRIL